jgi:hypothetical protein
LNYSENEVAVPTGNREHLQIILAGCDAKVMPEMPLADVESAWWSVLLQPGFTLITHDAQVHVSEFS